ncbi:AraC family transcriptional regulator [Rhodobacteraceae bacterium N5(2021)]|uniref:AraC family transcriptional regulator n=1 Tax=Gymnodinialimonas phycosphaerae TaxID=2841589 RepID=A0A975TXK3_9RHOB|nr:AraC family transcriptional regulator [Gymnodinialimonas phycosphaerae]MBY4891817.1 AraC family transcriptional regulator [Gymnodinialimonas phycosphaerae]
MVSSGAITRLEADREETVAAPAIIWGPKDANTRIRAHAGSNGAIMTLGEATLSNAIGHKPEVAALRLMSARDFTLDLSMKSDIEQSLAACFSAILRELDAVETGMDTVIEAQIRILMVSLWRVGTADVTPAADHRDVDLTLETFRHLVESHLCDRWPVQRFAQELGMSSDRLHDICTRKLGIPPQRLVLDRLTVEAQALLQRSHLTLDQIADYLGFRSTPQFSAFFKTHTGFPPGAFRKAIRRRDNVAELLQSRTYADWP